MPRDEMHNTIHDKSHNLSGNNLLLANEQWFKRPKSEREKVPVTFFTSSKSVHHQYHRSLSCCRPPIHGWRPDFHHRHRAML